MALSRQLKTRLSAAMLTLIAAGASASALMEQFQKEKEGSSLTSYPDAGGVWTICGGVTRVYGRPVVKGMKLTAEEYRAIDKVEQAKRWHGWKRMSTFRLLNRRRWE